MQGDGKAYCADGGGGGGGAGAGAALPVNRPNGALAITPNTRQHNQASPTSLWLVTLTATLVTLGSVSVPGLPGAQNRWLHSGDCDSFHASECSRPPLPTTSTFTCGVKRGRGEGCRLRRGGKAGNGA